MDAHRSRSLGMAALVFILISLTAAVFHGAAPVRAEDVTTPTPIVIDGNTADVTVELYTIVENRKVPLSNTTVLSTDTLYGSFSAKFKPSHTPSLTQNVAEYSLPSNVTLNVEGGVLYDGQKKEAGTWKCENNKLIFTFNQNWINTNPSDVHVGVNFSFKLANENVGSGNTTIVEFPGTTGIDIATRDGAVTGEKKGQFVPQNGGEGKVTWTLNLEVESYAQNVQLTDVLGENFSFVPGSFKLNGETLKQQPSIEGQTATLSLGNLSKGTNTVTYDSVMNPNASVDNYVWINELSGSKNKADWTWGQNRKESSGCEGVVANRFRYDMIQKSDGTGTPSDIKWIVTLNNGDVKTDMNGYTFTDTLDDKQTYTGEYVVYKGLYGENKIADGNLDGSTGTTFSYTFSNLSNEDKYQPYRIVYHTKMNNLDSYESVKNTARIEHEGTTSPLGTSTATFWRGVADQVTINKKLDSKDDKGRATWTTHVKLPRTDDISKIEILDTFQSTYKQNLKVESLTVKIGGFTLTEGTSERGDYYFFNGLTTETKINFNIRLRNTERVRSALVASGYQIDVTYTTVTDNLDGQYWNLAAVNFPFAGQPINKKSNDPYYIVNNSETPDVDKLSDGYTWDGTFDWSQVEPGSTEKGAWIATWTVYANRYKTPAGQHYGAGKLGGQPITIKDTLPADGTMSFVPGSATYTLYANPYDERREAEREVANRSVEGSVSGNEVTFSIPTTELKNYAGFAKLTYKTAIKRSVLNTSTNSTTLKNLASAESGSKTFGSGSGTVTIKNNVLQKTGDQVANSNRIKYTIWVNESAVDLKSDSGFLELVDVMDAKCTLVTDSVKVYQFDGTGWSLLSSNQYRVGAQAVPDQSGSTCTKMTLTVPDEEYLKVEYEIIPAGNTGEQVSLTNKASLKGDLEANAGHSKDWEIQKLNGSAVGSGGGITVTKVDASDITKKLSGAEFTLYEVDMEEALKSGVDGAMTEFQKVTTNSNGEAAFGSAGNKMKAYTLYCLKETTAPEGYTAISEPIWIMLKGQDEQQYRDALAQVESLKRACPVVKTPTASTDIMVSDEPYSGQAEISAVKSLQGSTLQRGQFEFVLKDANHKVLKTTKNDANGNINFVLDYTEEGTYKYFISEVVPEGAVNGAKDHITYDTTEREVTVTVTSGTGKLNTAVAYGGADPTVPPTFTNRYSTALPEAGGAGLTMTYLAGASLLCFAATWMHARRHRDQGRGGGRE